MSDSAFSGVGLLTQFSYLLLIFAMFPARLFWVRMGVMLSAAVAVVAGLIEYRDPVALFWQVMLLLVNIGLLARFAYRNARVRFNAEERPILDTMLAGLPAVRARHFLDQGFWLNGQAGEGLIREGDPVSHLFYLAAGEAKVTSAGKQVGFCRAGDLIGEVTVLSGDQASATVTLDSPARMWCAPARTLKLYLDAHHDVRHAVEMSFAAALRHKLRATNQAVAAAGGVRA
ncbi:Crp/Fnr family transcriptional regulator [uncultured Sphingomonas sp.]|uniref:Crp/Fnr family transcriptional regulator n=1 Tax=uncultured Sphingomonas sp. TaxID=158754 RepID=UPI00261FD05A|nr:cyclic nucleotide-binding domain-containing protein [uncultured Sphingomonas sp.]